MALSLRGILKGHNGWVTAVATSPQNPNMLLSSSRDKTVLVWDLTRDGDSSDLSSYGYPVRALKGHNHFVQDVVVSSDGQYALSASWDNTLRLWDLNTGTTSRRFVGHTNDVMSVAFSADNRQIVSGSRDKTIKLWNTLGQCKFSIGNEPGDKGNTNVDAHREWVSCVRFSPNTGNPLIVTSGWDKMIKVWNLNNCTLQRNLPGHNGYVNTVSVSPDGSLCASGGKDNTAMLWDLNEGNHLYSLEAGDEIHSLIFSPNKYWLCAATSSCIKIWDLQTKTTVAELGPSYTDYFYGDDGDQTKVPQCISLAWSADGSTLFSGYTDNTIRVWEE